eukprot:1158530-Pelagomonas_calceolata.AAC.5
MASSQFVIKAFSMKHQATIPMKAPDVSQVFASIKAACACPFQLTHSGRAVPALNVFNLLVFRSTPTYKGHPRQSRRASAWSPVGPGAYGNCRRATHAPRSKYPAHSATTCNHFQQLKH